MLGAVCLLGGAIVLALFIKNQSQQDSNVDLDPAGPSAAVRVGLGAPTQFEENTESGAAVNISGSKPLSGARGGKVEVINVPFADGLKKQIQVFQNLQLKSVMSEDEQAQWRDLLKNGELIRQIGEVLRSRKAMQDPQFDKMQSAAIDLIVQALKEGDEEAAADAAWDQIRDTQVEDSTVPLAERKILGGIKGEILYHATAIRPDIFQEVEMDLPGPASQKIWQNVQNQHRDNLQESQTEAEEYQSDQQQKKDEDP